MDRQREPQHRRTVREDGNLTRVHIAHPITKEHTVSVYDHPDYFSLVNAIRERPDDDLPRLVASDWLEEQGEEKMALFIRKSIHDGTPMQRIMDDRLTGMTWDKPAVGVYIRGFVEEIRLSAADWVTHADEIIKRNPIRKVTITTSSFYLNFTEGRWPGIEFTFERVSERRAYTQEEIDRMIVPHRLVNTADIHRLHSVQ